MFGLVEAIILAAKPLMVSSALTGVAYATYLTLPKVRIRSKLLRIFRVGEIYTKKRVLGKIVEVFPIIREIKLADEYTRIVFTIPFGVQPDKVDKALWAFRQQFGENIALKRDGKRFIMTARLADLEPFNYDYSEVSPALAGIRLPIVIGRSYRGLIAYNMVETPHLLVAGETGSGKSTALRAIICTLIQAIKPSHLHLYLGDLKRSEFHLFRRVQHVKEVATNTRDLLRFLEGIAVEMQDRGDLLDAWELSDIEDYNLANPTAKKPYIIVCIDEVSLLRYEKPIMTIVEDISAIGRALGVYLILSMQRPDAEVLDGKLKNNLTVRLAFRHADEINSRITIGTGEAAHIKLTNRGRAYLKHEVLSEVQAPLLSVEQAKKILEPYRSRRKEFKDVTPESIFGILD